MSLFPSSSLKKWLVGHVVSLWCDYDSVFYSACNTEFLPVWEHWVLNVQRFGPGLKPVDVLSHLSPVGLRLVPRCGEGSAVHRVRRVVPAAPRGDRLVFVCRCTRPCSSCDTLLCRNSPKFPDKCPLPLHGSPADEVLHVGVHRCFWG